MTCHAARGRARGAPQAQGRVERHARATPSTARVGVRPSQARAGGRRRRPRPSPAARGRDATGRDVDLTLKKPTDFARRAGARPHSSASRLATHLHGRRDHRGGHGERESHDGRGVWSSTTDRARICGAPERPSAAKVLPRKAESRIDGNFLGSQTLGSIDKSTSHRTSTDATATVALGALASHQNAELT